MDFDDDYSSLLKRNNRNLAELYVESQASLHGQRGAALPSSNASTATPQRSVFSTAAADAAMTVGASPPIVTTPVPAGEAAVVRGAQELLGSSFYYRPPASSAKQRGPPQPPSATPGTATSTSASASRLTLEQRLNQHENEILSGLMERATERTRAALHRKWDSLVQEAWDRDRQVWIQEMIGTRTLGGAASARSSLTEAPPGLPGATPYLSSPASEPGRPLEGDSSFGTSSSMLDISVIRDHGEILMRHLNPRTVTALIAGDPSYSGRVAAQRAIDAFLDLPAATSGAGASAGYRTAWQLMASLCAAGVSSPSAALAPNPVEQARAALNNLSVQFLTHMMNRLRGTKSTSNHQRYTNFTANTVASYVDVALSLDSDEETVWATVYYCLRAGNAVAAQYVVSASRASPGPSAAVFDEAVVRLLKAYAVRQGEEADNMWESASSVVTGPAGNGWNDDDKMAVQELSNTASSLFQSGTYALLSGSPLPKDDRTTGFCNIEDYLTSRLWLAVLDGSSPQQKLSDLGKSIRDFGPEYFGAQDPYSYAWPLLATQQYATALQHLASAGGPMGLLQATHLALVLTSLLEIGALDLGAGDRADASSNVVTSLLVKYSHSILLPRVGAAAALEYLARIPTRPRATTEVAQLLASPASNLAELAGTINDQGVRAGGAECLSTFGLDGSKVLSVAAEQILMPSIISRESMGRAIMCYMLGGRYAEVLRLLSRCLCPPEELPADDYGDREYWVQQATDFRSHFLSKQTHVLRVLERESPSAIATINALLGLNQFYGKLKAGQRDEAWELLSHSNLLPTSRADLPTKEASYRTHDQLVQNAVPALLSSAVANLFQEYQALRSGLQYSGGEVARTRIDQVKAQTKLYVQFAGIIGMTGEKMQSLSRMEALMG